MKKGENLTKFWHKSFISGSCRCPIIMATIATFPTRTQRRKEFFYWWCHDITDLYSFRFLTSLHLNPFEYSNKYFFLNNSIFYLSLPWRTLGQSELLHFKYFHLLNLIILTWIHWCFFPYYLRCWLERLEYCFTVKGISGTEFSIQFSFPSIYQMFLIYVHYIFLLMDFFNLFCNFFPTSYMEKWRKHGLYWQIKNK